jgi:hypothetical protein
LEIGSLAWGEEKRSSKEKGHEKAQLFMVGGDEEAAFWR